ncbi:phospholipase D-like domain-containing protein [Bacteriovorax sp. PP10]|uniref:phospholipase D n=1 Tax=Bacteriovorax antarcticus TaxID=3088717 RepID=A0ABU5VV90_9BACT|nr:phospholipase D-like domain-containing protein [Bacteriovorax sp. PP10]MEA9356961.1 phospholipase D-like domain-containing protein [Bacteriovorax sp. PP10]
MEAFLKAFLLIILFLCTHAYAEAAQVSVKNMDTCFSPREDCAQKLISVLNIAEKTLDIAIFSITHSDITNAIIAAKERGVVVRVVVDKAQAGGSKSKTKELIAAHIPVKIGKASGGTMHDKFSIVDGMMLQTGSFNYSMSAANNNTENQIYIADKDAIQRYQEDFEILWNDGSPKSNPASLGD